jgi:hypothetical protein
MGMDEILIRSDQSNSFAGCPIHDGLIVMGGVMLRTEPYPS